MIFGYFTLAVALLIEIVGAYYSITGLAAIFSGAVIPILIMGGVLELGKVTAAVWLKNNWHRASMQFKAYLLPAVVILMLITSMGIFGFLSKAHNDQNLVSGDVQSKIAIYDEKIKTARENIEANRRQLKQMDEAVDQVMARSTDEKGADKANAIRRSQQRDRVALAKDIETNQKLIASLNDEASPIRAEVRKVEAEVGPLKYIANVIYGDNPDANILEKAVTWVIIIIVAVFDPLALVLILAAQQSLRWAKEDELKEETPSKDTALQPQEDIPEQDEPKKVSNSSWPTASELWPFPKISKQEEPTVAEPVNADTTQITADAGQEASAPVGEFFQQEQELAQAVARKNQELEQLQTALAEIAQDYNKLQEQNNTSLERNLNLQIQLDDLKSQISKNNNFGNVTERPGDYIETTPNELVPELPTIEAIEGSDYVRVDGKVYSRESLGVMMPDLLPHADNAHKQLAASHCDFGTEFPQKPKKGDMFLRVDYLPNKLYKWNSIKWLEIDKSSTDSYTYNEKYIKHLIAQVESGAYDSEDLNNAERDQIEEYLRKNAQ
jgi:hypothetical protein